MNTALTNESWKRWDEIVERARQDGVFKKRLLAELVTVVKEHGLEVPPGIEISLKEKPNQEFELMIGKEMKSGELGDDDLDAVVGGTSCVTFDTKDKTIIKCVSGGPDKDVTIKIPYGLSW